MLNFGQVINRLADLACRVNQNVGIHENQPRSLALLPFALAQIAHLCGAISHIVAISPHTDKRFLSQPGSSYFLDDLGCRVTRFQEGYEVQDLPLRFWR
jgi:hypothetical protein